MISLIYGIVFILSVILSAGYIYIWHKHFDVNFTMVFTLVPIACAGYVLLANSTDLGSAITSTQLIYIGGSFLQFFIAMSIFNLCKINVPKWVRTLMFVVCLLMYGSVLSAGRSNLFYRSATLDLVDGTPVLVKEYGPMHTLFYVLLIIFFIAGIAAIVYSYFKKKQIPRRILSLLLIPDIVCVMGYFATKLFDLTFEFVPIGYVLAEFVYLLIAYRVNLYDVSDTVIDSMVQESSIGYISFDFKNRYLGSNDVAKALIPELNDVAVDEVFGYKTAQRKVRHYLDGFKNDPANNTFLFTVTDGSGNTDNDRYYNVNVNYLYDGNRKRGYIVTFADDTKNRKYIKLLDNYNENLKAEVEEKTSHIVKMHDNLIMSLAMMVESRDNSTGGHIKRTSEGVRILIDEIRKEGILDLDPEFCKDVIKAAPMHDLGKIAVDDAILRKPGRFEPDEYEKMKTHAAEGARVIHEILKNTDDERFKVIAENVAHYHHERYDGSGYPDRLVGDDIPLEARIMAIADVYDALVSKRVYKEAYDFKKADSIIMEGMGTQFDPKLKSAYENARPRLEEYYSKV